MAIGTVCSHSRVDDLVEPLAVYFSCFHGPNDSYLIQDVWDGENIIPEIVSKWFASKLKSIAECVRAAFSGYEHEVIQLVSRTQCKCAENSLYQKA